MPKIIENLRLRSNDNIAAQETNGRPHCTHSSRSSHQVQKNGSTVAAQSNTVALTGGGARVEGTSQDRFDRSVGASVGATVGDGGSASVAATAAVSDALGVSTSATATVGATATATATATVAASPRQRNLPALAEASATASGVGLSKRCRQINRSNSLPDPHTQAALLRHPVAEFSALQEHYLNEKDCTIVVVPAIDLDPHELDRLPGAHLYEQRQLYNLIKLSDPNVRVVFVSSEVVDPAIVGYYAQLKPGSTSLQHRLQRQWTLSPGDDSSDSLTSKISERKDTLLKTIAAAARGDGSRKIGLSTYVGGSSLQTLAKQLDLTLLEATDLHWGTKQGSRELFAEANVQHPRGVPSPTDLDLKSEAVHDASDNSPPYIFSAEKLALGVARQIDTGATAREWIIKLNQGFSGRGNAMADMSPVLAKKELYRASSASPGERVQAIARDVLAQLKMARPVDKKIDWSGFEGQMGRLGVIAEEFIPGEEEHASPSVQGIISTGADGKKLVHVLSTHQQILDGQIYTGCTFPASDDTARKVLMEAGRKIGEVLAEKGVIGHYAVDFLKSETGLYAIEVNLRQSGTSHPYATLALLTDGATDPETGIFYAANGEECWYAAKDGFHPTTETGRGLLEGLPAEVLIRAVTDPKNPKARAIHWDPKRNRGVVYHMLGSLKPHGKVGMTAIARTAQEADQLMADAEAFVEDVARNWHRAQSEPV